MALKMKPTNVIKARLNVEPNGKVHKYFTNRCAQHMDNYVPLDDGGLAYKTRTIETDRIIYNAPYAHYMYEGKVMGPNIPMKKDGIIVGWFSPPGQAKHYTGESIDYSKSIARGHTQAGPYWDKRMWSAESKKIVNEVQNYVNSGGK